MMSPFATMGTPRNDCMRGWASGHQPRNLGSVVMSSVRKGQGSDSIAPSIPCVRGSGRAIALELARRGFDVVATMRDPAAGAGMSDEAAEAGGRLRVQALDVTRPDTVRLPDGLRVLVNNAGVEREHLPVEETPLELWREMFETNLFGLVEVTRRAIPKLRAAGGGVLCNIGSSSILAPVPFYAAYLASKA